MYGLVLGAYGIFCYILNLILLKILAVVVLAVVETIDLAVVILKPLASL